jgi:hypothetical protein
MNFVPEALLDVTANTPRLEMCGGPGHVPPDMSSPPVSTTVEPTVTHAVLMVSDGCQLTLTVPLVHWRVGVGASAVVVVEDAVVELLHAARSIGSDAITSRPPRALRAELGLRVLVLAGREFHTMVYLHRSCGPPIQLCR